MAATAEMLTIKDPDIEIIHGSKEVSRRISEMALEPLVHSRIELHYCP